MVKMKNEVIINTKIHECYELGITEFDNKKSRELIAQYFEDYIQYLVGRIEKRGFVVEVDRENFWCGACYYTKDPAVKKYCSILPGFWSFLKKTKNIFW
jgi:hypothetical protein